MENRLRVLTTCAFILASGTITASAQQGPGGPMMQPQAQPPTTQQPTNPEVPGMTGQGGMMDPGMMGHGIMGRGIMGHDMMGQAGIGRGTGMMTRIIFSLIDSDGDGTISL